MDLGSQLAGSAQSTSPVAGHPDWLPQGQKLIESSIGRTRFALTICAITEWKVLTGRCEGPSCKIILV